MQKAGASTGQASGAMAIAKHVLHSTVTHPDLVQQAHVYHHAKMAAPAVGRRSARSYPWQGQLDPFTVAARGTEKELAPRLTWEIFDACLRQKSTGKASGADTYTNELLKHLPDPHRRMLFSFFQLCWALLLTPGNTATWSCFKKGEVANPANYRPIALHLTIYKLWTRIITQVPQGFAESVGMISSAQEGFRKRCSCERQLQLLTSILEDAKLSKNNMFPAQGRLLIGILLN
jgi:hypothetical protein